MNTSALTFKLCKAARKGNFEKVEKCLVAGANANWKMPHYNSALQDAIESGQNDMVKFLISRGADPRTNYQDTATALHFAALKNNVTAAQILIDNNVDVNASAIHGATPLSWAASGNNVDMCRFLLNCPKINVNKYDNGHYTPVFYAASRGHIEPVKLLVKAGANIKIIGFEGRSCLQAAKEGNHIEVVEYLESLSK